MYLAERVHKSSSIITLIILGFLLLTFKLFKSYQRRQQAKYQQSEFR